MPRFPLLLPHLLALFLTLAALSRADVLHMKDGRRIEGTVAKETAAEVVIDTRFGRLTFPRSEIREIVRGKTPRQEFDERWKEAQTAADFHELGTWADAEKLRSEAKKCMKRVLELEPQHDSANAWLGNVKHEGEWMTPEERDRRVAAAEEAEMLERGLVRHGERWVTPAEKEKLDAGLTYHDGRWLTPEELKAAQGLVLFDGEWREEWRVRAIEHADHILREEGGIRGEILTGPNVALAGPFDESFLEPIFDTLESGRDLFDRMLGTEPGRELLGGRLAEFYVFGRDNDPFLKTVEPLAALTRTVPPGWAEAVKKTHGFVFWDPFCVSSARALGRPLEDLAGHCYHHWGHLLLNRTGYDGKLLPPWFDEGFASLFEHRLHARNAVFCIAATPPARIGGSTSVKEVEFAFGSKEFRRGTWRANLRKALEARDPRVRSFDKLAQKQIGELDLIDIAMAMGITDWLAAHEPGALRRFHAALRASAPALPLRVHLKGAERQARYDAAFGAAAGLGWRAADETWRTWFLETSD